MLEIRRGGQLDDNWPTGDTLGNNTNILPRHPPSSMAPEAGGFYCYAIPRGGGSFTRLIPVDNLPYGIEGIPKTEPLSPGLLPLSLPTRAAPTGCKLYEEGTYSSRVRLRLACLEASVRSHTDQQGGGHG